MRNNESWCFDRASRGGLTRSAAKRRRVLTRCSLNSEKRGRRAKKSEHRLLEQLLLTKRKKRKNLHPSLSGWQQAGLVDGGTWGENKETTRGCMMGESQQPCGFTLPVSRSVIPFFKKLALCPRGSPVTPPSISQQSVDAKNRDCLVFKQSGCQKALLHEYISILSVRDNFERK